MINTSDYTFITDKLASAQQQMYNSLAKLIDAKARLADLSSYVDNSIPARFSTVIDETYAYILSLEIDDSRLVDDLTKALQNHILAHWS